MVSPEVQTTFDYLFGLAAKALKDNRSFVPFGTAMGRDGVRRHTTTDQLALTSEPIDHIVAIIAALNKEAMAGARDAGIVFDTVAPPGVEGGPNAVCVHAETVLGESVQVFVPYRRNRADEAQFAEPVVVDAKKRIFVA